MDVWFLYGEEPWNSTVNFQTIKILFMRLAVCWWTMLLCLIAACFQLFPRISANFYVCLVWCSVVAVKIIFFCMCCWLNAWFNEVSVMMISILRTHFARFQLKIVKKFRSYLAHYSMLMAFPKQFRFCPSSTIDLLQLRVFLFYCCWFLCVLCTRSQCSCCCCFARFVICSPCLPID